MSLSYIPSPQNPRETFQISIENLRFTVVYAYNPRQDAWFFSLINNTVPVLDNIKLTMGYPLGFNYPRFILTKGSLYLYSPQGYEDDPNLANFGKTVFLVYEANNA